jgi:hypothetical protein
MFAIFQKSKPILRVHLGSSELCAIPRNALPIEKYITAEIPSHRPGIIFKDSQGKERSFDLATALADHEPWIHLCIRISENFVCQIDCILSKDSQTPDPEKATSGIRFQPFFLPEFGDAPNLMGQGLIARGLHYPGMVTPGWVSLMVICDACEKSFRMKSFHTGFSQSDYAYCSRNFHTLVIRSPSESDAKLPSCQQCSGDFARNHALRCPHCQAPFSVFDAGSRDSEYYGAWLYGAETQSLRD